MPRQRTVVFGVIAALYVLAFPYHPGLRSPNELCRLWQARSLVDFHTLDLNQALRAYGPVGDLAVKDGRYFPSKAPLLSFAAAPLYAALQWLGGGAAVTEPALVYTARLFLTVFPTLLLLVLLRRFLGTYLSDTFADALLVTYAVGSLAFSYSLLFMSHQTSAVLLFGSFYALWRAERGDWSRRGSVSAGALAGLAVAAEYTSALPALALFGYSVASSLLRARLAAQSPEELRRLAFRDVLGVSGPFVLGALPVLGLLMAYHQLCFGHPLESGYRYLADAAYQPWHQGGLLGIRAPRLDAFALSFFSPLRGLLTLSPFLLLGFPGLYLQWSARRRVDRPSRAVDLTLLAVLSLVLLGGYTYFTSAFAYESWGWTTGPRHLTALVPFLLLPAGFALQAASSQRSALLYGFAAGLCSTSVLVTGLLSLVNYIPDNVSSPLFGLVWPLFKGGLLPPTALLFVGVPNPWSGLLPVLAVVGLAGVVTWQLAHAAGGPEVPPARFTALAAAGIALVHLVLLAALTAHDEADRGAVQHLSRNWMAPPGERLRFFRERP